MIIDEQEWPQRPTPFGAPADPETGGDGDAAGAADGPEEQGLADCTREKSAHEIKNAGKLQRVTGKAVVRQAWISHADVLFDREKDPNTES